MLTKTWETEPMIYLGFVVALVAWRLPWAKLLEGAWGLRRRNA